MKSKRAGSDTTFGLSCRGGGRSKPQRATNQALFNQRLPELELHTDGVPFDRLRCGGSVRPGAAARWHTPFVLARRVAGRLRPQPGTNQEHLEERLLELELHTDGVPFGRLRCGGSGRPGAAAGSHTPSGLARRVAGRLRPQPGTNQEHLDQRLLELELAVDDVRFDRLRYGGSGRPRSCRKVVTFDSFAVAVWSKP